LRERASRIGIAAISATIRFTLAGGLIAPLWRLRQNARGAGTRFKGLPDGLINREALGCRKLLGERLSFLGQIDHRS
jgi:hypothetical protein